jgi:hypothetical protein
MINNNIASWATKAGINIRTGEYGFVCSETIRILNEFAKYAIEHERNRCAKMCDRMAKDKKYSDVANETASQLAVKIRTVRKG